MCRKDPLDFLPDVESHRVSVEQPVPLPQLLLQLGLGDPQLADGCLHLLHLHLHQCDDVPLLVQLPQQLRGRGAGGQGVGVVQRAAGHAHVLHRRLVPDGPGLPRGVVVNQFFGVIDRRGVTSALRLGGQLCRAQVLPVLTYLHHGNGVVAGLPAGIALGSFCRIAQYGIDNNTGGRGGGGGRSRCRGFPASAAPISALIHPPQREERRNPDTVSLPAASEVHAANPVTCCGFEGAEAAADPGPGDVPEPLLPQRGVFGKCVEAQVPITMRVVVAARHTTGEPGHVCFSAYRKCALFLLPIILLLFLFVCVV